MNGPKLFNKMAISTILVTLFCLMSFSANALTTVNVTSDNVNPTTGVRTPVTVLNYRWLIEEDQTYNIIPEQTCVSGATADYDNCLSLNFHKSYMPVVAEGRNTSQKSYVWPTLNLDPNKRYYLSILPDESEGRIMGGAQISAGQSVADIHVTTNKLKTAQIRIFAFQDTHPTNNTPQPIEVGLAGVSIMLEDAGGRYGISGQQILYDIFGNYLGTTYNPDGSVKVLGIGTVTSGPDGFITIKNLAPAKYGIRAVPPVGEGWIQTSTIEGTPIIDAWVKADEPPYFAEFGPPGPHVFVGFVRPNNNATVLNGGATISGSVSAIHNSRPPAFGFNPGLPVGGCVVALSENFGGVAGPNLHVSECDAASNFSIAGVPAGNYTLSVWDKSLDYIFGQHAISVGTDPITNVATFNGPLDISLFAWFARIEQSVFYDGNDNGIWDAGEKGMQEVGTGIRWRDGTVYQGFPTDVGGEAPYDQVFPFFSWLIAEVDYSRYKATGVTVTIDDGGALVPGESLSPQIQANGAGSRTEVGAVLTQAFQGFLGQTSKIQWGKRNYSDAEIRAGVNGGISGIVFYAVTRAEDDPRFAGAEVWEPGIPRIQVALYEDNGLGKIKDINNSLAIERADVDNHPFTWNGTTNAPGPEDFDYNGNGSFDMGDAIQVTTTDSWDDNLPTGCVGPTYLADGVYPTDCFDGLRNFNQVRPGVFDGGYAFGNVVAGNYIVGTGDHRAYKTVKEEDKNVDFGVPFILTNQLTPECVGIRAEPIPFDYSLSRVTDDKGAVVSPIRAGTTPVKCNEKKVKLSGGKNGAVDFFMFTQVPVAGHIMGFILNDLANEFDLNSPTFGEKYSPPFLPVSIRDWEGNVIGRTYSDRWGSFNVLVPSTYTNNLPTSSGVSPNIITTCMNDPGPVPEKDAAGNIVYDAATGKPNMVVDPQYQKQYSQFCYNFNYMPGVTTYLDTPVLPIAAYAGIGQDALDCEYQTDTPVIRTTNGDGAGPHVAAVNDVLTIMSVGDQEVNNPRSVNTGELKTILRHYGFGTTQGIVTIDGNEIAAADITFWSDGMIKIKVPSSGNLEIIRDDGRRTQRGIRVTVAGNVVRVPIGGSIQKTIDSASVVAGTTVIIPGGTYKEMVVMHKPISLQGVGSDTVIDAANVPSTKLRDWDALVNGLITAGSVNLLPAQETGPLTPEQITLFTEAGAGIIVLATNQVDANGAPLKPALGAAISNFGMVNLASPRPIGGGGSIVKETIARIDGISITGSDNGGGIVVNGFARDLEISNNRVFGNFGVFAGGIRIGHPGLVDATSNDYQDAQNGNMKIHHNQITGNGASNGFGGGISMNHGSAGYKITNNYVCGNFSGGNGGGIGSLGFNPSSEISHNTIIFNQSFLQQNAVTGGGIFIGGGRPLQPRTIPLGTGSGDILIDSNLIQGNNSGAGNGGGISLSAVNGVEVTAGAVSRDLNEIIIINNIIVNNVAGLAGGGISLSDSARVKIINNTIAHNDSTGTSGEAFCGLDATGAQVCNVNVDSKASPGGIAAFAHTSALESAIAASSLRAKRKDKLGLFSNPVLANNIIWKNRSFVFHLTGQVQSPTTNAFQLVEFNAATSVATDPLFGIWDYGVIGAAAAETLTNVSSVLTDPSDPNGENNKGGDPRFLNGYSNGSIGEVITQVEVTTKTFINVQPAFDEGGNFIDVRFGPLSLTLPALNPAISDLGSNYHIISGSSAISNAGDFLGEHDNLANDIDGDSRIGLIDSGADEFNTNSTIPMVVNGIAINSFIDSPVASSSASSSSSPSIGGCTLQAESRFDPLLPLMMLILIGYFIRTKSLNSKKEV